MKIPRKKYSGARTKTESGENRHDEGEDKYRKLREREEKGWEAEVMKGGARVIEG